ncbi:LacI family DNA-binding transcriptional regulator [Leifsonia sp. NPDC058194]|uniref:LacI family DNA-binding transcriptional regulator n=1 Tax=Leifsonia sp. NPDC058194 TaxID=3346374 RepID=UPI0036DD9128
MTDETAPGPLRAATLADVAREAGVSPAAVSKVIRGAYGVSDAMRERVGAAIERLDYRPRTAARAMRGTTTTLGITVPQLGNEFFTAVVRGAVSALDGTGFDVILAPSEFASSLQALESLLDRQVAGIVAIAPPADTARLDRLARHAPLVQLGGHEYSEHFDTVAGDDRAGAQLVLDHLLGLGHRRIAHLTHAYAAEDGSRIDPHSQRLSTYAAAMRGAGLDPLVAQSGASEESAYRAALELLDREAPPTAIFAANDTLALGVLRAVAERGLTAADVSVAGYDDIDIARHPLLDLTTVDQRGEEMGGVAATMLLERLGGRTVSRRFRSEPALMVRGSTRRVREP